MCASAAPAQSPFLRVDLEVWRGEPEQLDLDGYRSGGPLRGRQAEAGEGGVVEAGVEAGDERLAGGVGRAAREAQRHGAVARGVRRGARREPFDLDAALHSEGGQGVETLVDVPPGLELDALLGDRAADLGEADFRVLARGAEARDRITLGGAP